MIYEPQNGTEEFLMLAGRVEAFAELVNWLSVDVPKELCAKMLGFEFRDNKGEGYAKDNSAVSNNEVD